MPNLVHEELGVVHLDVKPDNILLDNSNTAKLGDFGSAKKLDSLKTYQSLRTSGTALYYPPESFSEEASSPDKHDLVPMAKARDVWALGCTLFILLFGELPFPTKGTREDLKRSIQNTTYPPC